MFDIGWSELLVIAVVMIVIVGPKDLPKMLRAFGKATAKLRSTASEFRTHFDEALREAELDDVKKTIDDVKKYNPRKTVTDLFEPVRSAGDDLRNSLSNATPKPDETPVAMDTPLDLSEMKEEEGKPAEAVKPAAIAPGKPAAPAPDSKTAPASGKDSAPAPVKKTAKAPAASKVAKPKVNAEKPDAVKKPAVKKAAPKTAETASAKPATKTTKRQELSSEQ
ncbi:Sec-independent protein translocase protein TatB [Pseudochrobactrum sp. MP213Fo]|uniref:Sec-independent protein translocase protein TatB n=1 Tax=Pseudochrobactrum sp. MP213Fo TaxID=3022250 RepID=UPI003B9F5EBF